MCLNDPFKTNVTTSSAFYNPSNKGKHLQKFFVIGRKKDEDFSKELLDEMEQYDDFVVGDFVDSYLNLTMKTFVAHTFAQEHCHEAEWVVLHDDDAIVDWRKALKGLLENTKQLNLRCFYSPPRRELPMRLGRNHVSGEHSHNSNQASNTFQLSNIQSDIHFRNSVTDRAWRQLQPLPRQYLPPHRLLTGVRCQSKTSYSMASCERYF